MGVENRETNASADPFIGSDVVEAVAGETQSMFRLRFSLKPLRALVCFCLVSVLTLSGAPKEKGELKEEERHGMGEDSFSLDEQVRTAISDLQTMLLESQAEDGSWTHKKKETVGPTALAVMALVRSGLDKDHPQVQKGIEYLLVNESDRVAYNESFVITALKMVDDPEERKYKDRIKSASEKLIAAQHPTFGHWGYGTKTKGKNPERYDNSTTQIAVLGLAASKEYGFAIPDNVFERSIAHWERTHQEDGSWRYSPKKDPSIQMTCAGIASLHILGVKEETVVDCGVYEPNPIIKSGFDWIDQKFFDEKGQLTAKTPYQLYALERVALYLDKKEITGRDWYLEGVKQILKIYESQGETSDQAFLLLFLAKGFTPIAIAKWKWDGDWDNHHDDMGGWMEIAEEDLERKLDWMPASIDSLDSPASKASLIYANGLGEFKMSKEEGEFLRSFLDQNGTIVLETCQSSETFVRTALDQIGQHLYPGTTVGFRPIDDHHPVLKAKHRLSATEMSALEVVVGCKKVRVLILTRNFSCALNGEDSHPEDIRRSKKVATNLLAWALQSKDATRRLDKVQLKKVDGFSYSLSESQKEKMKPGLVRKVNESIARIAHNGDWNVNEHFFQRLQELIKAQGEIPHRPAEVIVKPDHPDLLDAGIAFMSGHKKNGPERGRVGKPPTLPHPWRSGRLNPRLFLSPLSKWIRRDGSKALPRRPFGGGAKNRLGVSSSRRFKCHGGRRHGGVQSKNAGKVAHGQRHPSQRPLGLALHGYRHQLFVRRLCPQREFGSGREVFFLPMGQHSHLRSQALGATEISVFMEQL